MNFPDYISALTAMHLEHKSKLHLRAGASLSMLEEAERRLGFAIGEELKAAWEFANGSKEWATVFSKPGMLQPYSFLSVSEALEERKRMRLRCDQYEGYVSPHPRSRKIRPGWFQEGWLPFASFGGATLLLIQDFTPSTQGRQGQIISFAHDPDSIDYVVSSFSELLPKSIKNIKRYSEEFFEE